MLRRSLLALLPLLVAAPVAQAAPDCPDAAQPRTLVEGQATLESVAVDPLGRLLFSVPDGLLVLDRPGAEPRRLATFDEPGGIVFESSRHAIVGTGNSIPNGMQGDATGPAGLVRVDLVSGAVAPFASGLSMANGVARGLDGTIYATNDFGSNVDRVGRAGGEAERGWAKVDSGNGVAIDSSGRWLYVAQTFRPAAIQQVDLRDPSSVTPYVVAEPGDTAAGLDGMAIDASDRLFAVGNGSGELWRVEGSPSRICIVVRGLPKFPDGPSAVAVGRAGTPFPAQNVYVVTFDGHVYEFAGVAHVQPGPVRPVSGGGRQSDEPRRQAAAPLRVRVSPRRARAGRRTRFTITAERYVAPAWRPVAGARVRFAGRFVRTNRAGRAVTRRRFARPGRRVVRMGAAAPIAVRITR